MGLLSRKPAKTGSLVVTSQGPFEDTHRHLDVADVDTDRNGNLVVFDADDRVIAVHRNWKSAVIEASEGAPA